MRKIAWALAAATILLAAGCSAGTITAPRYVLSYGISDYPAASSHLTAPEVDAQALNDLLVSEGYVSRDVLKNSAATKANIRADIQGLSSVESDAIVVIFFSGHGTYVAEGELTGYQGTYIDPYDAVDVNGYVMDSTAANMISPAELSDWLSLAGTRNVILILNTCYSGGFVDPGSSIDLAPQNYGPFDGGTAPAFGILSALGSIGDLISKNSRDSGKPGPIVISASGSEESTYELTSAFDGHGIFPFYILRAADSGDANSDGFVTATEAYEYAVKKIKSDWNYFEQFYYDEESDQYYDFMPHISGGARDLVLFSK
jgi:uncharacterized caspase-like protein